MPYYRRVLKRRPASLTDEEWSKLLSTRFVDRGYFVARDAGAHPPADVSDMAMSVVLANLRWRLEKLCMSMSKPSTSPKTNGSLSSVAVPGQLLGPFSELWEFLTGTKYADGTSRQPGLLSLKLSSTGLQVTLTDNSSGSYCCLTAMSLDDLFLSLEVGLKEGSLAW